MRLAFRKNRREAETEWLRHGWNGGLRRPIMSIPKGRAISETRSQSLSLPILKAFAFHGSATPQTRAGFNIPAA